MQKNFQWKVQSTLLKLKRNSSIFTKGKTNFEENELELNDFARALGLIVFDFRLVKRKNWSKTTNCLYVVIIWLNADISLPGPLKKWPSLPQNNVYKHLTNSQIDKMIYFKFPRTKLRLDLLFMRFRV